MIWENRLGTSSVGFPITYELAGKQYLAVPAGQLGPYLAATARVGQIHQPPGGNEIYVFELPPGRSEEHTSELQSLMRISYTVFCSNKKNPFTSDWKT